MCSKDAYPSYRAARSAARRITNQLKRTTGARIKNLEPYACPECGDLHLTTHSKTGLKKVG